MRREASYGKYDFFVCNDIVKSGKVLVIPFSEEYVKEFFNKEIDYTIKEAPFKDHFMGFASQNGPEAMRKRSIFAEVFKFDNLKSLVTDIRDLTRANFGHVTKQLDKTQPLEKNIKKTMLLPLFNKIADLILFGNEDIDKLNGPTNETISQQVKEMFGLKIGQIYSVANLLSFGLFSSLKFTPSAKKLVQLTKSTYDQIRAKYEGRQKAISQGAKSEVNILDLMIDYENKNSSMSLSVKEVIENCQLFQFAANDTSYQASTTLVSLLTQYPKIEERLRKEISTLPEDYNYDQVDKLTYLTATVKELLRYSPPTNGIQPRLVTKTMPIKDLRVKKGDLVGLLWIVNFNRDGFFKDPLVFNPDRFLPKELAEEEHPSISKILYSPFSLGQRRCIGQYLGEAMIKVVVIEFLRTFKLETVSDKWRPDFTLDPMYGVKNATFKLKKA